MRFVCLFFCVAVFGVGLCSLSVASTTAAAVDSSSSSSSTGGLVGGSASVPAVVLRLLQEIEARASATPGLDLYRLYRTTTPPPEIIAQLRAQLADLGSFPVLFSLCLC